MLTLIVQPLCCECYLRVCRVNTAIFLTWPNLSEKTTLDLKHRGMLIIAIKGLNPIRAEGAESARPFFRWLFLHEKRGFEVQNFVTFPNSL